MYRIVKKNTTTKGLCPSTIYDIVKVFDSFARHARVFDFLLGKDSAGSICLPGHTGSIF